MQIKRNMSLSDSTKYSTELQIRYFSLPSCFIVIFNAHSPPPPHPLSGSSVSLTRAPSLNPLGGGILSQCKRGSIANDLHPSIVLLWLKYCSKDCKITSSMHSSILSLCSLYLHIYIIHLIFFNLFSMKTYVVA